MDWLIYLLIALLGNGMIIGGFLCLRAYFRTDSFYMLYFGALQWAVVGAVTIISYQ